MSHHFYLPQLTGENISVPKDFGHWSNNERKIILGIGDSIAIDEQTLTKGVSSIPDIWARPLLFQSALKHTSKHPLRNLCMQEWRGLLSLLALHKIKPELSDLEITAVSLDDEKFSHSLRNLTPSPIQLEEGIFYNWTDILLIKFKGVPVGAFSPTTLVYTAVEYNKKLVDLPFALKDKNGYLSPPETKEDGLEFVGEWLYVLQQKLTTIFYSSQSNPHHQIAGNLNHLIGSWLAEIRQKLGLKENEPINVKTHKISDTLIDVGIAPFLKTYRVYEQLLYPVKKDDAGAGTLISDILLQSTRQMDKKVVVITEKILSVQTNIWDEMRPNALGKDGKTIVDNFFNGSHGTVIGSTDIGKQGGMWIRPELYFLSNTLLTTRDGDLLNQTEEELNIKQNYILPFRKEILDYFSVEDIKDVLKPTYSQDGDLVKFSFTLPVGNGSFRIEKTYKTKKTLREDGEIQEIDTPIIDIFPNYLGPNWRKYFMFQGNAEFYTITPVIHQEGCLIKSREREYRNGIQQKTRVFEISGDNPFPEAAEIRETAGTPLGLILLKKQESINQGLKSKWTIGIDFGTSNTNVYRNRGANEPAERWRYEFPQYYRQITANNSDIRKRILEEFFFPTREVVLPIPTTLKIYNLAKKESVLLDYFIYYPQNYQFPENVSADIKWDGTGERKTEYFLESLLFLLLIEVVKNGVAEVELACSYPKAFSHTNVEIFKREWRTVFDKLLESDNNSSRVLNVHSGKAADNELKVIIREPVYKTEGIAAGEYFASDRTIARIEERANKEIAAICLDVGGATTDISIWYRNKIEFDSSVLLAGRQLSNLLQINSRVRELLFSKEAAIALEEKRNESAYFSARLNLILKNEEDNISKMLVRHANNKDVQWLRQIIALEFGSLSFFAAQVCISTDTQTKGLLSRISSDGINLHWGGNAAKLINWIDFGRYSREGIASKILNATFFKCLDDPSLRERAIKPKQLMQLQSPEHKCEAAGGMVVMDLSPRSNDSASFDDIHSDMGEFNMPEDTDEVQNFYAGIVCGENIEVENKTIEFFTPLSNKDLFDVQGNTKFMSTSLDRLTRFVEILNFFGIKYGLFTEDTKIILGEMEKRIIRDGVRKEFIKMETLKESQRLIEPIFIMEIKLLLEIIKSKMI